MQTKDFKILLAGGIIDFYVNRKKFEGYRTERGQFRYVQKELEKYLTSLTRKNINSIEIRDVSITSNNFWGQDTLCQINDLGYNYSYQPPINEKYVTIRIFQIDLVGIVANNKNVTDCFFTFKDDRFQLAISNVKLV